MAQFGRRVFADAVTLRTVRGRHPGLEVALTPSTGVLTREERGRFDMAATERTRPVSEGCGSKPRNVKDCEKLGERKAWNRRSLSPHTEATPAAP